MQREKESLRALGGHLVPIRGYVNFDVMYQRRKVSLVEVPVIGSSVYPLILGQDWMAAVEEDRIVHREDVGFQVDLGGVEGPCNVESGEKRAGIALHASNSTVGEHSELRQPGGGAG